MVQGRAGGGGGIYNGCSSRRRDRNITFTIVTAIAITAIAIEITIVNVITFYITIVAIITA